ncbi:MAG: preprotein translocase subunit SecY [Chloroflexi bacterium ADurb.Bin325]|nr:MAG: preprotein translocase subunit SecY [Chloroflexi bacterium ADurb.Bin325]
MIEAVRNAFRLPDLRRKLLITLGILVIYRLAAHIPVPGVNRVALAAIFQQNQLLGLLNLLSGGALSNFSVMAMGVYPYITASIIVQLLAPIVPQLQELQKEGEAGRTKLNQYTNILTIPLALLQGFGQSSLLANPGATAGGAVLSEFGFRTYPLQTLVILASLTAGTMLAMWLGQLITEQGIGNGVSIIIFGGIISSLPANVRSTLVQGGVLQLIAFILVTIFTVAIIVVVQEGQRRIPVQYGKRVRAMRGNRLMVVGGQSTHVPLRVNSAGMIPLIFASSMLVFPGTIASYLLNSTNAVVRNIATGIYNFFNWDNPPYWIMYFLLVVAFTYFYTDVIFRQQNLPETLQRQGGFIPGIRPGINTERYLNRVLSRITLVGALFLGFVAILPWLVHLVFGIADAGARSASTTLLVSSTGLLIVVGVVLDTMKQLEAQLLMRHYEGFIRK